MLRGRLRLAEISRRAAVPSTAPHVAFDAPSLIGSELIAGWPAVRHRQWTVDALATRFGTRLFTVTVNGVDEAMNFNAFVKDCAVTASSSPASIFDPSFDCDAPELLDDYVVPAPFGEVEGDLMAALPPELRPDHRWFLVGPKGSGSGLHVDVLATTAWNALVVGEKQWVVAEPDTFVAAGDGGIDAGDVQTWFAETLPDLVARSSNSTADDPRLFTFTQRAGETVVVPRGWAHAVLNTSPWAVAVTHNFVCPREPDLDAFLRAYAAAKVLAPTQLATCEQLMRRRLAQLHKRFKE